MELKEIDKYLEKDKDGLYKAADNYEQCRAKIDRLRSSINTNQCPT